LINTATNPSVEIFDLQDLTIKLADFGETVMANSPPRHKGAIIQARQWAPPEVRHGQALNIVVLSWPC
jgi:hypothetical protein